MTVEAVPSVVQEASATADGPAITIVLVPTIALVTPAGAKMAAWVVTSWAADVRVVAAGATVPVAALLLALVRRYRAAPSRATRTWTRSAGMVVVS